MRRKIAHVGVVAAWLLACQYSVYAQQTIANSPAESQSDAPCPTSNAHDEEPTGPEISIAEVTFLGSLQMPVADQAQIADSVKEKTHGVSLEEVRDEALERARAGWQDRGYFKVQVSGDTKTLTSNPASQRIALNIQVDEGVRYTLRSIKFKNNKAIKSTESLRGLFPIREGDIFSREKIAIGLENLRKAYGELGYINFTSVPDTTFDDENRAISVEIDLDEGKKYYVSSVNVFGLEEAKRQDLLNDLHINSGQILTSQIWEKFLLKYSFMLPECPCRLYESRHLDEDKGTVAVTLDFRPCSDLME